MYFYRNGLPVYKEMKWLAEVKRFSMAVMFLSEKDKKGKYSRIPVTRTLKGDEQLFDLAPGVRVIDRKFDFSCK